MAARLVPSISDYHCMPDPPYRTATWPTIACSHLKPEEVCYFTEFSMGVNVGVFILAVGGGGSAKGVYSTVY